MFSKLADKAFGFLDVTYFATGVVPALLLTVVVSLDARGDFSGLSSVIGGLSKGDFRPDHLLLVLAVVAISIVFYLFASGFVELYSEPFGAWERPRSAMAARERAAFDALGLQLAEEEARYSAIERYFAATEDTAYYVPPGLARPDRAELERKLVRARKTIDSLQYGGHPSYTQRREVEEALLAMYVYRQHFSPPTDETPWHEWRANAEVTGVIQRMRADIGADIQRRMTVLLEKRDGFPPSNEIRGTRLGNVLGAMDAYGERRYRIPSGVLWDRVWWLLGKEQRGDVAGGKTRVQVLVECSFVAFFCSLFVLGHAVIAFQANQGAQRMADLIWQLALAGVLFLSGLLFYSAAVSAAQALSQLVRSVLDTQVLSLMRAMGFAPATVAELADLLGELRAFFLEGRSVSGTRPLQPPKPAASGGKGDGG